ncbi:hypothetical protein M3Y99_00228900 [Aphelenchoides fujianensis]|nr:hypothetical protein M3Y99_00228900 [Aphelenchoides fujianensis]
MEAAVVKRKPQMRAAVRDGLNRFHLFDKEEMGNKKPRIRFMRDLSRSIGIPCRCIARIKFQQFVSEWMLELRLKGLGLQMSIVIFFVNQTEMRRMVQLLDVPVHLDLWPRPDEVADPVWQHLKPIESYVNGLTLRSCRGSAVFSEFITSVAPQLKELKGPWVVLPSLPPLDLKKLVLYADHRNNYELLKRHRIHRLDVVMEEAGLVFRDDGVLSSSIKSLGLVVYRDLFDATLEQIQRFCRRFTALEELQITGDLSLSHRNLDVHFKKLWAKCLELRDRLEVPGLKRLYFTIKHASPHPILAPKVDWTERLKQTEPFDKATFATGPSDKRVRMFLKHNEPWGPKPTFFHIEGDFYWLRNREDDESDETDRDDDSSQDAMEEDGEFEGFGEDAMDDAGVN